MSLKCRKKYTYEYWTDFGICHVSWITCMFQNIFLCSLIRIYFIWLWGILCLLLFDYVFIVRFYKEWFLELIFFIVSKIYYLLLTYLIHYFVVLNAWCIFTWTTHGYCWCFFISFVFVVSAICLFLRRYWRYCTGTWNYLI